MVLLPTTSQRQNVTVATAGSKGQVRLWSISNKNEQGNNWRLVPAGEQIKSECFGEERGGYTALLYVAANHESAHETLIVADAEHNLSYLSIEKLEILRTLVGHNDDILDLKILPPTETSSSRRPERIVVATNSAKVKIFDLHNFSCHMLDRHTATVLCVDVSPCGRYVATCGKDKQMWIWSAQTLQPLAVAIGHTEAVGTTALSRNIGRYEVGGKAARSGAGAFAVTASIDRTLKRWNLPGSSEFDKVKDEEIALKAAVSVRAHEKDINIVVIAPNDSMVATGSQDKTVKLWRAADLAPVATLKGHRRGVWDCQFSPFDRVIATASGDHSIKLWSLSDFACVRTFQGHVASVLRVRFLANGLQLMSSGADGLLKLWTVRNNECEATMDQHDDKVWALDAFGDTIVSGGADSRLVVWEDSTQEVAEAKQVEEKEAIATDQQLANHLRHKEYSAALRIALKRDKPLHALKVLSAIIETRCGNREYNSDDGLEVEVKTWPDETIQQVLKYCRDWNTKAKNALVAMTVTKAILSSHPIHKLASIDGVPEIFAGLLPYAERHFDRLDRLYSNTFLIDYALSLTGALEAGEESDFTAWAATSQLVLPPKVIDGRVQIRGTTGIGSHSKSGDAVLPDADEVVTVGESDESSEEE